MQNNLKFGIIGVGNMGTSHAKHIFEGKIKGAELSALCDIDPNVVLRLEKQFPDVPIFSDYNELLQNSDCDAVIVATEHYFHPTIAKAAFLQHKHVLSEKPIGVFQHEIEDMIKTAKNAGKAFGIMFNQRTNPLFRKAKELVESGELGLKKRLVWQTTNWYRTQSYYESSPWRASWHGEGGGVLMNQAPHQLDLLQWIFGMPSSVYATLSIGKYHNIEVEDDAELIFKYDDGSSAVFITSTGEAPGTNRLEISGDRGKIVLEEGKLKFWKLNEPEREFCFNKTQGFYEAPYEYSEFIPEQIPNGHIDILQNFCNHILFGETLIASGFDGIYQSQMTSGAYLSHFKGEKCALPCDSAEQKALMEKLILKSNKNNYSQTKNAPVANENEDHSARWQVRW